MRKSSGGYCQSKNHSRGTNPHPFGSEFTGLNAIFRYPVAKAFWDTYGVIWSEFDPEFASGVTQAIEGLSLPSDLMSDFKANIEKYNNAEN